MTKVKLYKGDSSEDEDEFYSLTAIPSKLQATDNLVSSFLIEEVAHSILHKRSIVEKYITKKKSIADKAIIKHEPECKDSLFTHDVSSEGYLTTLIEQLKAVSILKDYDNANILSGLGDKRSRKEVLNDDLSRLMSKGFFQELLQGARFKVVSSFKNVNESFDHLKNLINKGGKLEISRTGRTFKDKTLEEIKNILNDYFYQHFKDLLDIKIKESTTNQYNWVSQFLQAAGVEEELINKVKDSSPSLLKNIKIALESPSLPDSMENFTLRQHCNDNHNYIAVNDFVTEHRPNNFANPDDPEELFVNYKIDHRIMRGAIKTYSIAQVKNSEISHTVKVNNREIASEKSTIDNAGGNGSRKDLVGISTGGGSYEEIQKTISASSQFQNIEGAQKLVGAIKQFVRGKNIELFSNQEKKQIAELTYLLFRCEPERNPGAFLTNAMFLELLERGKYTINDITNKMPMAMSGAVNATRSLLDQLGGKYREGSPYLTKRQFYDFKDGDINKARELAVRDTAILIDWLSLKKILNPQENMQFGNIEELIGTISQSIREIPADHQQSQKERWRQKVKAVNDKLRSLFSSEKSESNPMQIDDGCQLIQITSKSQEIFKAFHNLVYEWYGIRLEWLYSFKEFQEDQELEFIKEQTTKLQLALQDIKNISDFDKITIEVKAKLDEAGKTPPAADTARIILNENNEIVGIGLNNKYKVDQISEEKNKAYKNAIVNLYKTLYLNKSTTLITSDNIEGLVKQTIARNKEFDMRCEEKWNSQKTHLPSKSNLGLHNDQELSKHAKPVQGFYSNDDVNILIEALLKEKGISLDGNTREVTSENEAQTVKTYILEARSLNTNNIASVKKEDYLHDLARDVGKILLNEGKKQILIPIRLENEQHWVAAQLNVSQENKISAFIYDSAYRDQCLHNDIIYELSKLFDKKDQLKILFEEQSKATIFHEGQSKKLVEIVEKFEIQEADIKKVQNPTGTKLINIYCGGYAAHLIANLAVSQKPAWGNLDSIDSNQRLDDAILVNQYLPLQAKSFAKEGDNFESKKISQQKDHKRLELANQYFDSEKETFNKILEENRSDFNELFKFLDSYDKGTVFKPGTIINHQQLLSHLRNLPQEVESNFNFLKLDQTDRVFNDALTPEQIVYVLLCLKGQSQIKGNNSMQEGLNISDIKINLDAIINANQDNTDFYISPKIMEQEELLSNLSDWQTIPYSHYSALIKLENESGDKHAVLFNASKAADHLAITITDPLSQEASTFKSKIENLTESLHEEGRAIKVVYSGRQDEDYGTCADMSLIMLQELIEKTANESIASVDDQIIAGNCINLEQIKYDNSQYHNDDYDNHQHIEVAGEVASFY